MEKKPFLTEKNYFDYVFNRSALSSEIIAHIEKDPDSKEKTEYYLSLKTLISEEEDLTREVITKIAAKIPAFSEGAVIELYPLPAADDSPYLSKRKQQLTFADMQKNYFVHIEEISTHLNIWLFSPAVSELGRFRLTFMPSGSTVVKEDNMEAAVIEKQDKIDLIRLEF